MFLHCRIEIEVFLNLIAVLVNSVLTTAGVGFERGVIRERSDLIHVSHNGIQAAFVVRNNHADVGISEQFPDMGLRYAHADRPAVFRISFRVLNFLCSIKIEGFSGPHIVSLGVQSRRDSALRNGRDQRHVDLYAGKAELLGKQRLLGIGMCRELCCRQVIDHLHIVEHHSGYIVGERLDSHAAHSICLGRRPGSRLLDDLIHVLHVSEGSLRSAGALL